MLTSSHQPCLLSRRRAGVQKGHTALHMAAARGCQDVVSFLVKEANASVHATDLVSRGLQAAAVPHPTCSLAFLGGGNGSTLAPAGEHCGGYGSSERTLGDGEASH